MVAAAPPRSARTKASASATRSTAGTTFAWPRAEPRRAAAASSAVSIVMRENAERSTAPAPTAAPRARERSGGAQEALLRLHVCSKRAPRHRPRCAGARGSAASTTQSAAQARSAATGRKRGAAWIVDTPDTHSCAAHGSGVGGRRLARSLCGASARGVGERSQRNGAGRCTSDADMCMANRAASRLSLLQPPRAGVDVQRCVQRCT